MYHGNANHKIYLENYNLVGQTLLGGTSDLIKSLRLSDAYMRQ